jgi:hypothetical protein
MVFVLSRSCFNKVVVADMNVDCNFSIVSRKFYFEPSRFYDNNIIYSSYKIYIRAILLDNVLVLHIPVFIKQKIQYFGI